MAEHRPYRFARGGARAPLTQLKLLSVAGFGVAALIINWRTTQQAAWLFGNSAALGSAMPGGFYPPWEWITWWIRWHDATELQPVWNACIREACLQMMVAFAAATGVIGIARWWLRNPIPDLHGSARWANSRDVRKSAFIARRRYIPLFLRRALVRAGLLKPIKRQDGIYLGAWRSAGRLHYLRDCGPGHVLVEAPTRAGKGVNNMVPTLLTWAHSALIHDFKAELWELTAGARKQKGHICLKFRPTDPDNPGIRYNPLQEIRLRTAHETTDVQNIVQILVDPTGRGFETDNYWVEAGMALLSGAILHILYTEPAKTLRGLIGLLSDPASPIEGTMNRMMTAVHDPDGSMGWRDFRGQPTRTHPLVAESMREVLNKAEKERSGVIGEVVRRLPLYRDPLIAAATEYSEFRIDDLANHEQPVSLYLSVPYKDRERLRPLMRLMINQIVRRLTEKLAYKDGRPVSPHRRPFLLMLDEFGLLGHFGVFAEAMSHMAGFGIRACLAVQTLNQIYGAYGRNESITGNCGTTVRFTPNSIDTAEEISRLVGQTSVRHSHRTRSENGRTVSEPEVGRPLMTPDEARRMRLDEVLIFARGQHPIRASLLEYYKQPHFKRLSDIKPPAKTDRILAQRANVPCPVIEPTANHTRESADQPKSAEKTESSGGAQLPLFLKSTIDEQKPQPPETHASEGKERLL